MGFLGGGSGGCKVGRKVGACGLGYTRGGSLGFGVG